MVQAVFQGDPWPRELGQVGLTIGAMDPGKRSPQVQAACVLEAEQLGKVLITLTKSECLTVAGQALEALIDLGVKEVADQDLEGLVTKMAKDIKAITREEEGEGDAHEE